MKRAFLIVLLSMMLPPFLIKARSVGIAGASLSDGGTNTAVIVALGLINFVVLFYQYRPGKMQLYARAGIRDR